MTESAKDKRAKKRRDAALKRDIEEYQKIAEAMEEVGKQAKALGIEIEKCAKAHKAARTAWQKKMGFR